MNPALHMNCETLTRISPCVVKETLGIADIITLTTLTGFLFVDIAIEIFDKCRKNRNVSPLTSIQHFRKLNLK